jgi:hypothetical protein
MFVEAFAAGLPGRSPGGCDFVFSPAFRGIGMLCIPPAPCSTEVRLLCGRGTGSPGDFPFSGDIGEVRCALASSLTPARALIPGVGVPAGRPPNALSASVTEGRE